MISAITTIWQDILDWLVEAIGSVQGVFYTTAADGGFTLTFLGTLAVISVGIGIVFLVIGVIQNFLHLRS